MAQTGIRRVELAQQYGGLSASALRAALDERHLTAPSAHLMLEPFEKDLEAEIAFLRTVGGRHAVYPYHTVPTEAEWFNLADRPEGVAQALASHDLTLSYHHHDHELTQQFQGQPVLDLLLERVPSGQVELDVAWIHAAGHDPIAYIQRYADRLPLLHLKDIQRDGPGWQTVTLGTGEVPLQAILSAVPSHTQTYYEQDHGASLETVRQSLVYLK